jgi:hypothetical protein
MNQRTTTGKILRLVAIVLLSLTAAFTLLGGIGTSCIALAASRFAEDSENMAKLVPYQWLYFILMVLTIAAAIYAIRATVRLARSRPKSYRDALIAILACLFLAAFQMISSRLLRGGSQPNDMRVYASALTLLVFLLLRIPSLLQAAQLENPSAGGDRAAGPAALVVAGITVLTVHLWAAPSHTFSSGVNWADVWHSQLAVLGWGLVIGGVVLFARRALATRNVAEETLVYGVTARF